MRRGPSQLYTQAAEQGYPPAQCALGYCYEVGSGTAEDKTKAVEWYEKGRAAGPCHRSM